MTVQTGLLPGMLGAGRTKPIMRSPVNPYDKSTVVSIFPIGLDEHKPTAYPGRFILPPGTFEEPSVLVVGPSSSYRDFPDDSPIVEIPAHSVQVADSIIRDYCDGLLECDMDTAMPGLFFIPAKEVTVNEVKSGYNNKMIEARDKQNNWYKNIVRLADALWSRSNQNPLAIWDAMRVGAIALGLDKPWLKEFQTIEKAKCFACGELKNPEYPICPNCKTNDPSHPKYDDVIKAQQKGAFATG